METPYSYISSINYIKSLTFDYIETYSFQRGPNYEEKLKLLRQEHDKLKIRKEKRNNLSEQEEIYLSELYELSGYTQYLINEKGQFHPSSKKTNTFQQGDPMVDRLTSILHTKIDDIPMWLCAPIYRDAIVFYNNSKEIISVLNVCLSCQYMETAMFKHINGDYETYDLLKRYFIDIGHDVEEPTKFIWDELKMEKHNTSNQKQRDNSSGQ
jgi:hypothetical protein